MATGCSCRGGRSHQCLLSLKAASVSVLSSGQEVAEDVVKKAVAEVNVFIKPLSGNSFAMNIDLSMVKVKDLKKMLVERSREALESLEDGDLILEAEKTLWATGRMGLEYAGKHLKDSKLLGDYDVEKDSTIKIVFGLFGEGPKEGK